MPDLRDKTLFITGASRGIGKAIALRAALDGANIAVAAKTTQAHPRLPGTIYSAAAEIEAAGGRALPLALDIRDGDGIRDAVEQTVSAFGAIDIVVNNASAIQLTGTLDTTLKRYDLMHQVNARGSFAVSQACLPHLLHAPNPHILALAPPPNLNPRWFRDHTPYTLAKYGMSLCMLGLAAEFGPRGVGVNCLWPRSVIHTAALAMLGGRIHPRQCRTPDIVADAAYLVLTRDSRSCNGNFFIDEELLRAAGISDFSRYAVDGGTPLAPDLFLD